MSKSFFLLSSILLFLFTSCVNETITQTGSLQINVISFNGENTTPVVDALLYTKPATKEYRSDSAGIVLIQEMLPISYEIFADKDNFDGVKSAIRIKPDTENKTTLIFVKQEDDNQNPSYTHPPQLSLILPVSHASFTANDQVVFSLTIKDYDTPFQQLAISILSDKDGEIFTGTPDAAGNLRFVTTTLSKALHQITIKATDPEKNEALKIFSLPNNIPVPVQLNSVSAFNGNVTLAWNKYTDTDFLKYEIYRANTLSDKGERIGIINSPDSTFFTEIKAPFVKESYYYVRICTDETQYKDSKRTLISEPGGKIYSFRSTMAVHHPNKPIIYCSSRYENKINAINYKTNEHWESLVFENKIGVIDVADNGFGVEVYVPCKDGNLYIYDGETLRLKETIEIGRPLATAGTNGNGFIVFTTESEYSMYSYARAGLKLLTKTSAGREHFRFLPNSNDFIGITAAYHPYDMVYFKVSDQGELVDRIKDQYHGWYPLDYSCLKISPNGKYVITSKYGSIYSASKYMIFQFNLGSYNSYCDFEFDNTGDIIYASHEGVNKMDIISYANRSVQKQITTRTPIEILLKHKNELIGIGSTTYNTTVIEQFGPVDQLN